MKKISLGEFKSVCEKCNFGTFIFSSANQQDALRENITHKIIFTGIKITLSPNIICFTKNDDYIKFQNVEYIEESQETSLLGRVFEIVCDEDWMCGGKLRYTFIAR